MSWPRCASRRTAGSKFRRNPKLPSENRIFISALWDGTHYRPLTYRKARKSLKTGHFPDAICMAVPDPAETGGARYAIGSGPVYWVGPAAKSGQQLVGRIGDNPCIVGDFGVRHNVNERRICQWNGPAVPCLANATTAHGMVPPFDCFGTRETH